MITLIAKLSFNFAPNLLQLFAKTELVGVPRFGSDTDGHVSEPTVTTFRHYPLSELEARSMHFKGSSPVQWVENHVLDLLRLCGYREGYDMREVSFEIEYDACLIQQESGGPHIYVWSHDRKTDSMTLTDNGQIVEYRSTRGPQEYQSLGTLMEDIRAMVYDGPLVADAIFGDQKTEAQ